MKSYRPWNPTQSFLLPPSPEQWLPEGHLAFFILDAIKQLDISEVERVVQQSDARGVLPYAPRMMLGLLIYGYCMGICSSRRIARATHEDVPFRVLAGGAHPHFSRISDFRLKHLRALRGLFLQVLRMCQLAGMVKLGHVALDGTKMQANASKHKAMSYGGMNKLEAQLTKEIDALLERAKEADRQDDERLGAGQAEPDDVPAELARRETRLEKLKAAKAALEAEARKTAFEARLAEAAAAASKATTATTAAAADVARERAAACLSEASRITVIQEDDRDDPPPTGGNVTDEGLTTHRTPATSDGLPTDKAQRNFTDPDSRIMKTNGGYLQGYNCQQAVDDTCQVIVAQAVSNQGSDNHNLQPMMAQVQSNCGAMPEATTADTGYWHPTVMAEAEHLGTTAYVALGREKDGAETANDSPARQAMRERLRSPAGRATYRKRKFVVEPVHGQIKEARGIRRFLLRGLSKVGAEWSLVCLAHNLLKLYRYGTGAPAYGRLALAAG